MNLISLNEKRFNANLVFFVRLFFCYYYDFNGNSFIRYLAKLFCIVCGATITCFSLYFIYTYYLPFLVPLVLATLPMILGPTYLFTAIDINHVPRLSVLFLILSRMHLLSRKIENYSLSDFVICERTENWSNYINVYWQLMDCFKLVEPLMKNLILINLLTTFPKLMMWIYHTVILADANSVDSIEAVIVTCIENAHVAFLTSLPGVLAAMIQAQVDRIKFTLATRLYQSKDVKEIADIKKFLKLIELRPFEMRILRVIPVDMNLPVGLLSLCATYLIVLAQFHE